MSWQIHEAERLARIMTGVAIGHLRRASVIETTVNGYYVCRKINIDTYAIITLDSATLSSGGASMAVFTDPEWEQS